MEILLGEFIEKFETRFFQTDNRE